MLGPVPFGVIVCSRLPPLFGNTVTGDGLPWSPGAGIYGTNAGTLTSPCSNYEIDH
jgi:hypothetical protein